MSILTHLIERSTNFVVNGWELNREQDSDEPVPFVAISLNVTIPEADIEEDLWYSLDDNFKDPETGTTYYSFDFDGDGPNHWGRFAVHARGTDIPEVLDILRGEIDFMLGWLTTLSGKDTVTG